MEKLTQNVLQLFPGDLPLLHSFLCHSLPLPCLRHSFCVSSYFLFPTYLLNHQLASLRWIGFAPGWCTAPKTKTTPPLLHSAHDIPVSECCLCLFSGKRWGPLPPSGQDGGSLGHKWIVRIQKHHLQSHFGALVLLGQTGNGHV